MSWLKFYFRESIYWWILYFLGQACGPHFHFNLPIFFPKTPQKSSIVSQIVNPSIFILHLSDSCSFLFDPCVMGPKKQLVHRMKQPQPITRDFLGGGSVVRRCNMIPSPGWRLVHPLLSLSWSKEWLVEWLQGGDGLISAILMERAS